MPTDQILELLIQERNRLNRAIEALQSPARRGGRGRGSAISTDGVVSRRGHGMSLLARKAQSRRMKAYWVTKRKAVKPSKKS
jgi:hypothetical protein